MSLNVYLNWDSDTWVFDANITHNLGRMAEEAGIYKAVWCPEEIGITTAEQLIEPLYEGICLMIKDPKRFEVLNAPNGWGLYENFLPWLMRYLRACQDNPKTMVSVHR